MINVIHPLEHGMMQQREVFSQQELNSCHKMILHGAKKADSIYLDHDMAEGEKVFLYYQLDNFYQNHRRYVKSRSNDQLNGKLLKAADVKSDCDPVYQNSNLWEN